MIIAICEIGQESLKYTSELLKNYLNNNKIKAEVFLFDNEKKLLDSEDIQKYDLIFLDIFLESFSGIDVAQIINKMNKKCKIIFVSEKVCYVPESYDVSAFYYFIKPIKEEHFTKVMNRYFNLIFNIKTLNIKTSRHLEKIFLKDIVYIESVSKKTVIHTRNSDFLTPVSLYKIDKMLPKNDFYRPIRYAIISFHHVKEIKPNRIIMRNNTEIPVSRNEKKKIGEAFKNFKIKKNDNR